MVGALLVNGKWFGNFLCSVMNYTWQNFIIFGLNTDEIVYSKRADLYVFRNDTDDSYVYMGNNSFWKLVKFGQNWLLVNGSDFLTFNIHAKG